jgi:hypothetical protein
VQSATRGLERAGQQDDTVLMARRCRAAGAGTHGRAAAFLRGRALPENRLDKKRSTAGRLDVDGFSHIPYTDADGPSSSRPTATT